MDTADVIEMDKDFMKGETDYDAGLMSAVSTS